MDQHHIQSDQNLANSSYPYYPQQHDPEHHYAMGAYGHQISPYSVVPHPAAQSHQPGMGYQHMGLMASHQYPGQQHQQPGPPPNSGAYGGITSPQQMHAPIAPINTSSPPPASPNMYDPISPPVSGSDTSADGLYHHHSHHHHSQPSHSRTNSSGTNSPSSSRGTSLVHRNIRYSNPTPSPTSSSGRRSRDRGRSPGADSDEEEGIGMGATRFVESNLQFSRKEATRRQRIEAEQRRRDELRDGYAKLKDVLPVSNQKSSKVSLLERATNHISTIERTNQELQERLASLETEVARLRGLNEKISLSTTGADGNPTTPLQSQHAALSSSGMDVVRPLSPPPEEGKPLSNHSLANVRGQEPPREESGSPVPISESIY